MCKPFDKYESHTRGAMSEIISAMSALNMEPSPLPEPKGDYLSERDEWAAHAMEHLHAAMREATLADSEMDAIKWRLLKLELADKDYE